MSASPFSEGLARRYLRLNVLEQNLQLYGLSPESSYADPLTSCATIRGERGCISYAAVGGEGDGPCAGRSCHTDRRSKGREPPFCNGTITMAVL